MRCGSSCTGQLLEWMLSVVQTGRWSWLSLRKSAAAEAGSRRKKTQQPVDRIHVKRERRSMMNSFSSWFGVWLIARATTVFLGMTASRRVLD